jgi:two-component sensor histidine kinase
MHNLAGDARASPGGGPVSPALSPSCPINRGSNLVQAIVDTIREPLVVLDDDLRVVLASQAFCAHFKLDRQEALGHPVRRLLGKGSEACRNFAPSCQRPCRRPTLTVTSSSRSSRVSGAATWCSTCAGCATRILRPPRFSPSETSRSGALRNVRRETCCSRRTCCCRRRQHRTANSLQIIAGILLLDTRARRNPRGAARAARRPSPRHVDRNPPAAASDLRARSGDCHWALSVAAVRR